MKTEVTITGLDELAAEFDVTREQIETALKDAVVEVARGVQSEARNLVPVNTGTLRNAISVDVDGLEAEVFVATQKAGYGHYVELGTSKQSEHPFMGPAAELERGKIEGRIRDAVKAAVDG